MGKVIPILAARSERETSVETAWQRFVDANNRAKETGQIKDGIAAGKAYRAFLELYEPKR